MSEYYIDGATVTVTGADDMTEREVRHLIYTRLIPRLKDYGFEDEPALDEVLIFVDGKDVTAQFRVSGTDELSLGKRQA